MNAGFCGPFCGPSFDEDVFDEQAKKDSKQARREHDSQPAPKAQMSTAKPEPERSGSLNYIKADDP